MSEITMHGPIEVKTKVSLIRHRLETAIMGGALKPNDRLVVDEIAREFGVSKIPVREALSSLESSGLVVQVPHSGPRVAPLLLRELRAVYLLREEIETLIARLATESIGPSAIQAMREKNEQMRRGLESGEVGMLSELNTEFHLIIAKATTYQSLVDAVGDSLRKVRRYRAVETRLVTDWSTVVIEHEAVIDALNSGDPDIAGAAVRAHVQNQRQVELSIELEAS